MVPALRAALLPMLLLVSDRTSRCQLSTESGTGELRISGTVHFLEIESGCWQLETSDGRHYELQPGQAPESLLRDGVNVLVLAQPSGDNTTGCQVGMPIAVRRVLSVD